MVTRKLARSRPKYAPVDIEYSMARIQLCQGHGEGPGEALDAIVLELQAAFSVARLVFGDLATTDHAWRIWEETLRPVPPGKQSNGSPTP